MARQHRSPTLNYNKVESLPPISNVRSLPREALLALWIELHGTPPPARLSQTFLRRFIAFDLQACNKGPLPQSAKSQLAKLATGRTSAAKPVLKSGGRYLREWNGVTHVVDVTDQGHLYKGETYQSLSAVARAITGAHWSGPRFFGAPQGTSETHSPVRRRAK
ncbi:MAG: DUF2924 domain-containing protein [Sulfitobacter sp.]|uniref:DUF2924 domain-containing protein n=1 Tax=Sulfitobacter sp. TaxID=1903071 RepID=UPI003002FFC0